MFITTPLAVRAALVDIAFTRSDFMPIAGLPEIYSHIRDKKYIDHSRRKNFDSAIRFAIQTHSSDSMAWKGNFDWFYSVEGIGTGTWGLRLSEFHKELRLR